MKWSSKVALALAAAGTAVVARSFMPVHFDLARAVDEQTATTLDTAHLPAIEITFLRCGSVSVPECIAVRGALSLTPRTIAHSAVLIRHPRATFLYDSGLCTNIAQFVQDQSLLFRQMLGRFVLERPISAHLHDLGMMPADLDFVLLSHLHWDHVSGLPDLPGVPLHVNRVEYEAARLGLLDRNHNLVPRLMGYNPLTTFDCAGPAYEGFHSSYDLLGDGSLVLVPLPGHTAGNTGLFVNRTNGSRLFLIGDAAWVADNYLHPAPFHPLLWSQVTSDDATARQTLLDLYHFSHRHPEIPLIAMHDASMQEAFMSVSKVKFEKIR